MDDKENEFYVVNMRTGELGKKVIIDTNNAVEVQIAPPKKEEQN